MEEKGKSNENLTKEKYDRIYQGRDGKYFLINES